MTDIFIKVQVNPMTIVEFFDREMLENIIGTLMFQPERVVLFGRDLKKLAAFQKTWRRFWQIRIFTLKY